MTQANLPIRIKAIYNSCSPEEQQVLLQILQELSQYGYSETYNNIWLEDFKEIPVDLDTFLTDDYYLGGVTRNGDAIYPYWREVMDEIVGAGNQYQEIVFTGATRIGKSSTAITLAAYYTYWLMCLRDPQKFFNKKDESKFSILFFNLTLDLAKGIAFREYNDTLRASPWFCLSGDTEILTNRGYIKLSEACNRDDLYVGTVVDDQLIYEKPDSIVLTKYVDEYIEVELEDGTIIKGTSDHRVMLSDGTYKCLGDITESDDIKSIPKEYYNKIPDYGGTYLVSNRGNILSGPKHSRNWSTPIKVNFPRVGGYPVVYFSYRNKQYYDYLARIMIRCFLPSIGDDRFYMIDGNRYNTDISNLGLGSIELGADWKPVPGTRNLLFASKDGELFAQPHWRIHRNRKTYIPERILYKNVDYDGYFCVDDADFPDIHFVHRAVLSAFVQPIEGKPLVNHKDGNKQNNAVSNLEWCTHRENVDHAKDLGLLATLTGRPGFKVVDASTDIIYKSIADASRQLGDTEYQISKSLKTGESAPSGRVYKLYEG